MFRRRKSSAVRHSASLATIACAIALSMVVHAGAVPDAPCGLAVDVSGIEGRELTPGTAVEISLQTRRDCHVMLLLRDAHGVVEIYTPLVGGRGTLLEGGRILYLPGESSGVPLPAVRLPYGPAELVVAAYPDEFPEILLDLLDRSDSPIHTMVGEEEGQMLLERTMVADVQRSPFTVIPTHGGPQYTVDQVLQYFTETTRSVTSARLDEYINFAFNEAEPLAESRSTLALWGAVLSDPLLKGQRFRIGGHTDDLGSAEYNRNLSRERARIVRDRLIREHGVDPAMLEIVGYGNEQPLFPEQNDEARAINRRVEFERIGAYYPN